ncbi:hypothetical protein [Nocardia tenerifensis]|uniref:hypothetical protein n=1 Tax=Nocardia tenerifensis TaxID=228006 RepID=UPI0011B6BA17|nr:hypothetical protein [Nocardia tenerifensis]
MFAATVFHLPERPSATFRSSDDVPNIARHICRILSTAARISDFFVILQLQRAEELSRDIAASGARQVVLVCGWATVPLPTTTTPRRPPNPREPRSTSGKQPPVAGAPCRASASIVPILGA